MTAYRLRLGWFLRDLWRRAQCYWIGHYSTDRSGMMALNHITGLNAYWSKDVNIVRCDRCRGVFPPEDVRPELRR